MGSSGAVRRRLRRTTKSGFRRRLPARARPAPGARAARASSSSAMPTRSGARCPQTRSRSSARRFSSSSRTTASGDPTPIDSQVAGVDVAAHHQPLEPERLLDAALDGSAMGRLGAERAQAAREPVGRRVTAVEQRPHRKQVVGQAVERHGLLAAELEARQRPRQRPAERRAAARKLEQLDQLRRAPTARAGSARRASGRMCRAAPPATGRRRCATRPPRQRGAARLQQAQRRDELAEGDARLRQRRRLRRVATRRSARRACSAPRPRGREPHTASAGASGRGRRARATSRSRGPSARPRGSRRAAARARC